MTRDILDTSHVPVMMGATLNSNLRNVKKITPDTSQQSWGPTISYDYTLTTPSKRLRAPTVYVVFLVQSESTALAVWGAQVPGCPVSDGCGTLERMDAQGQTLTNRLYTLSGGVTPPPPTPRGDVPRLRPRVKPLVPNSAGPTAAYDIAKLTPMHVDKFKLNGGGVDWTKDKILAWRLEVWHAGRFITGYTRQNTDKLKEFNIPAEWYAQDFGRLVSQ